MGAISIPPRAADPLAAVAESESPCKRNIVHIAALAICGALLSQPALAASTERVSVASDGGEGSLGSAHASINADGRFVAFGSSADTFVTGDTNGSNDIFVRDRRTGTTQRVSVDSSGGQANGSSYDPSISGNGRFVTFYSPAANLVAGDTNGVSDVFVHDRQTGITRRVNVDSNGAEADNSAYGPRISASGRFVTFESDATNLVAGDTNGHRDIFMHDLQTSTTERVSVDSNGAEADADCYKPSISANGRFVAFYSLATNLVAGDNAGDYDVFVHDRLTGATERVSLADDESEANNGSYTPSISADGRFVAFAAAASNLVANDTNDYIDIFVRDRVAGTTERISVASDGSQGDNGSFAASISADGRFVTFYSSASSLSASDTNGLRDVFVRDRLTGTTRRASEGVGGEPDNASEGPSLSADGRFLVFESLATNLVAGDTNGKDDVFVRDQGLLPEGNDDLAIDFGGAGLWQFLDNATWQKIHNASPIAIASGDLDGSLKDETIASFAGAGLWARYDNATWVKLHNAAPALIRTGDLDGNGSDELIVGFGSLGLWVRYNNATWVKRHKVSPQDIAIGDLDGNGRDEAIVDFGGAGLWVRTNDKVWAKLHNASPVHMATGDLDGNGRDELIADFGGLGVWARYNNASWVKLHNASSEGLATGDLDGNGQEDLMVDFGGLGLWVRYNNARWVKRHAASPEGMLVTDLDGNGKAEAVIDFGALGLWVRYNDAHWVKRHNANTQDFAAAGVD